MGAHSGELGKKASSLATGNYNYEVAEKMFGPPHVYLASHKGHDRLPPVIAYLPGVINSDTTHENFITAVEELAKLSVVTQHIVGWPGLPMGTPWSHLNDSNGVMLHNPEGAGLNGKPHTIPWTYLDRELAIPYPPYNDTLTELSGVWNAYTTFASESGCMPVRIFQSVDRSISEFLGPTSRLVFTKFPTRKSETCPFSVIFWTVFDAFRTVFYPNLVLRGFFEKIRLIKLHNRLIWENLKDLGDLKATKCSGACC